MFIVLVTALRSLYEDVRDILNANGVVGHVDGMDDKDVMISIMMTSRSAAKNLVVVLRDEGFARVEMITR